MSTLPLCLVTGFLGSGKTTLLKHIAQRYRDRRLIYLVNEFAPADVDGKLVAGAGGEVVTVAGGSIFCQCKVGEFISQLAAIHQQHIAGHPFEGVVIEASGIADPQVVGRMLIEAKLDDRYRLARVVVVIDPGTFGRLLTTLPNIRAQVRAADLALVNKADLHSEGELAAVEESLREIQPGLLTVRTERCAAAFELFGEHASHENTGELTACADPRYAVLTVRPTGAIGEAALRAVFAELADDVYRAKGFVRIDERWVYADHAAGRLTIEPAADAPDRAELVVIVSNEAAGKAREALGRLL